MGLHINEKLMLNDNYREHVVEELKALDEFAKECNTTLNKDNFQAYFDLCTGKNPVLYKTKDGDYKQVQLKALKFDLKQYTNASRDSFTSYMDQVRNDFNEIADRVEAPVTGERFMSTSNFMYMNTQKRYSTYYKDEEVSRSNETVLKNGFGYGATKPVADMENLKLKDQILATLDAKQPEEWLDCLPNQEIINECINEYNNPDPEKAFINVQFQIGGMIEKRKNGVAINDSNIKPVLGLVQAKNDQYKNINGFRKFLSYINPFKDSVRDLRNEINEAKQLLTSKRVDPENLDSFLDGKLPLEAVHAPKDTGIDSNVAFAENTFLTLDNFIESNKTNTKLVNQYKADKILLTNAIKGYNGEFVDVEASIEEINSLFPEKDPNQPSRYPIGAQVEQTLIEDGVLESENNKVMDKEVSKESEKEIENQKEINVPQAK